MGMSINGYKLPKMSALELNEFSKTLGKDFRAIKYKLVAKATARVVTNLMDLDSYAGKKNKESYSFQAWSKMYEYTKTAKNSKELTWADFSCSVVFFPMKDKTLAIFYSYDFDRAYQKHWESLDLVDEYWFDNRGDKPDSVSDKDWNQRGSDWELVLEGPGIPSQNGLIAEFCDHDNDSIRDTDLVKYVPSYEKRIQSLVDSEFSKPKNKQTKSVIESKARKLLKKEIKKEDLY
jgi:hypothetical protein